MRAPPGTRTSTWGLLAGNAVPLVGVLALGWEIHSLLVVYWLESAVVGAASVAKILRARGVDDPDELPSMRFNDRSVRSFVGGSNRTVATFFLGHYGGFWLGHGVFVFVFPLMLSDVGFASPRAVAVAALGLVGYHAVSYWRNFLGEREFERSGPVTLMVEPYRRVLVLHVTVVLGAFAVGMVGAPLGAVAVLVVVKTVLDLRGHWREHERARRRPPSPAPSASSSSSASASASASHSRTDR